MKRGKPAISVVKSNLRCKERGACCGEDLGAAWQIPLSDLTVLLVAIGVIVLFSASYARAYVDKGNAAYYFVRQAGFAVSGIIIMLVVSRINYQAWRAAAFLILAGAILPLVAVPFMGTEERARRAGSTWASSAFSRLRLLNWHGADVCGDDGGAHDRMQTLRYGVAPYVVILGIIAVLLYLEPHMSATIIPGTRLYPHDARRYG